MLCMHTFSANADVLLIYVRHKLDVPKINIKLCIH